MVELVGLDREAVLSVVESESLEFPLCVDVTRERRFRSRAPYVFLSDGGGCACGMLTDEADWDAPTWDMDRDLAGQLAETITMLGEAAGCDMSLQALWAGDSPTSTVEIDLHALSDLAARSLLGTRTRYLVTTRARADRAGSQFAG